MAIITISRGTQSGGRAVAQCLAERLGYPCLAMEILESGATKLGVPVKTLRGKLETTPGLWERVIRDREKYVVALQAALLEASEEGRLVYHGLAGQFLLAGCPGVLRVRLVAPLEKRLSLLQSEYRMDRDAAEDFIRNADQERSNRVRMMFDADVEDLAHYDLTVNLRTMGLETACEAIAEAASQPPYQITAEMKVQIKALAEECRARLATMAEG